MKERLENEEVLKGDEKGSYTLLVLRVQTSSRMTAVIITEVAFGVAFGENERTNSVESTNCVENK